MQNLSEIAYKRAQSQPDEIAYRFFRGPTLIPEVLTFQTLWEQAASIAAQLQENGLAGKHTLLACNSQKLFVIGFFACLLAGCVAVPTPPPRRNVLAARLKLLATDADVRALISDCDETLLDDIELEGKKPLHIDMRKPPSATEIEKRAANWLMPSLTADSAAFLQYTSGSTSAPKGVIVTHGNLMRNCAAIQDGMGFSPASSILTALPLFHDMGLVGGVLESMYAGCIGNCMPPAEFVQYPERWLQIISTFQITISGGPNFMYDLAARTIPPELVANCNLSTWRVAFCGAEPIRASTMRNFMEKFAPLGLAENAFYPCYGMAESTLFITGKQIDALPEVCSEHGSEVVNCGAPRQDTQVVIVNPDTLERITDSTIGEIWVSGDSVSPGYWQQEETTRKTFAGIINGADKEYYLRTGDLGYMKNNGLYVTGRLKDLIIKYGKKYSPQDIEREAELHHPALREGGGAAFSVTQDGVDRLILVFELKREWLRRHSEWASVRKDVGSAVNSAFGVTIDHIVFIKTGTLPRTSSGKVRRSQTCLDYLAGALDLAIAPASEEVATTESNQDISVRA